MIIDVSNPNNVIITATGGVASTASSLSASSEGFTIENFFTSAVTYPSNSTFTGNLTPVNGTSEVYESFGTFEFSDDDGDFKAGNDLSVYALGNEGADSQIFEVGVSPFAGAANFDFSAAAASLPSVGTVGNIYSGYYLTDTGGVRQDHGRLVGQYEVIPEPSSAVLCAMASVGFVLRRRRS